MARTLQQRGSSRAQRCVERVWEHHPAAEQGLMVQKGARTKLSNSILPPLVFKQGFLARFCTSLRVLSTCGFLRQYLVGLGQQEGAELPTGLRKGQDNCCPGFLRNEFLLKVATGFLGESALCVTFFASTLHLGRNTGASKWEGACGIFLKGRVDKLSRNVACACEGLRPEARVGHFTIYGGGYYSYLYARCLSSAIWTDLLAQDPLDKGAGLVPDLLSSQSAGVALAPASVT
eukprot:1157438-Pelagomonas_calceolata.AAC.11